jgi:hypothetical protein
METRFTSAPLPRQATEIAFERKRVLSRRKSTRLQEIPQEKQDISHRVRRHQLARSPRAARAAIQKKRALTLGDMGINEDPNPVWTEIGSTTKFGKFDITVLTREGEKIVRAPPNLILIKDDHSK